MAKIITFPAEPKPPAQDWWENPERWYDDDEILSEIRRPVENTALMALRWETTAADPTIQQTLLELLSDGEHTLYRLDRWLQSHDPSLSASARASWIVHRQPQLGLNHFQVLDTLDEIREIIHYLGAEIVFRAALAERFEALEASSELDAA